MEVLLYLVPITLALGGLGLVAFLWSVKTKQYEDLDGAARRILFEDGENDKNETKNINKTKEKNF